MIIVFSGYLLQPTDSSSRLYPSLVDPYFCLSVYEKGLRLNNLFNILWLKLLRMRRRGELSSRFDGWTRKSCFHIFWYTRLDYCWYCFFCCSNRFPFVACEIFTCEVDIILKTLVEDEEVKSLCCVTLFYFLKLKWLNCLVICCFLVSWWICCFPFWNQKTPIARCWLGTSARYIILNS